MKKILIFMLLMSGGCATVRTEVPVVKPWEGRYESEKSASSAIEGAKLEKGESIWLLSNSTLKRLLKTTKE